MLNFLSLIYDKAVKSLRGFKLTFVRYSVFERALVREACASICVSRGQRATPSVILNNATHLYGDRLLTMLELTHQASCLPKDPPVSTSQSSDYKHAKPHPTFYLASGRSKLGPHSCPHPFVVSFYLWVSHPSTKTLAFQAGSRSTPTSFQPLLQSSPWGLNHLLLIVTHLFQTVILLFIGLNSLVKQFYCASVLNSPPATCLITLNSKTTLHLQ